LIKNKKKFSIAIDGGAASGKSTGSKIIAKTFKFKLLTSGELYRFVAYKMLLNKKKISNKNYLKKVTQRITYEDLKNKKIYSPEVSAYVSTIAKVKFIRDLLQKFQKNFSKNNKFIIEGRDIASKILPDADLKLFFRCSVKEKAKRRLKEFKKLNKEITLKQVEKALKKRDLMDKNRKESPLLFVKGAVLVDTTKISIKEMEEKLKKLVKKAIKNKYGNL
jgi:cytidylate kinase